ncbi:MAG: hypothetical protein A3J27_00300 [Candidatus Tectomicrobia bacterium RIFCSPLOWO2_12_FULL_69_37]|nr:MAG: hypothetical protein A3J27_00300 [Candidatus Tectomicrobia bacterium RIFCSPLOWO2_12_FULL_69_37]OGL64488.1 MAG: hypothetical protein A3I72_12845 [Candidatus Tectomicrobia bacterium RIFCSPLOWO2_02_FULL_70_19]
MANLLKRLFNIRPDEMAIFGAFFAFYFIIGVQFSLGLTIAETLFLSEVGPSFLPYMYIFNAVIIIMASAVYTAYTDKLSVSGMFAGVLAIFVGLILAVRLLIGIDLRVLAFPIAIPLLHTLNVMFTNMIPNNFRAHYGLYMDVLQSKRLVPIILTGGRYGGIVGGILIPILLPVMGSVANLLFLWAGTIFVSIGFIYFIDVRLRSRRLEEEPSPRRRSGQKPSASREGNLALVRTNRYVAAFALFSFIVVILRTFQDFQYSIVFREAFPERRDLATFLAYFTAIGNTIALLIQTFITPRLIRRLGLGTANLIYPFTTLIGLGVMAVSPTFLPAVFLRFNNRNIQESIRNTINALLYNAVPTRIRGRIGALVSGQVVAFASILSGVILLAIKPSGFALFPLSLRWVAVLSLVIGLAYLAAGFVMRREYGAALRKMLEDRTLGLFRYAQEGFGAIDAESMALLLKNLREGDGELCLFAAGMLAESDRPEALTAILEEIPRRQGAVRAQLLRLLGGAPGAKENTLARGLLLDALLSGGAGERVAAMDAVERLGLIEDSLERAQESLRHPSPEVRVRAVRLLVRSDDLFWLAAGLQTLHAMLEKGSATEQVAALQCITELGNPRLIRRLIPYLRSPHAEVREAAVRAIEHLLPPDGGEAAQFEEVLRAALPDLFPAVRRCAVRLMGARGSRLDFQRLLATLSDPDSLVRYEAVGCLKAMKRARALYLEGGPLFAFLGRWLPLPANGRAKEFPAEELIQGLGAFSLDHLREVYEVIGHLDAIEREGDLNDVFMLRKVLWDKVNERQRLLIELLGVIGDEKTVDTVSTSLAQGGTSFRALAIETLTTASTAGPARQLILLLEPLLAPGSTAEKVAEGRKQWNLGQPSLEPVLRLYMGSTEPWLRAVAADAAGRHLAHRWSHLPAPEREGWLALFRTLAYDEDPLAREAALSLMGRLGGAEGEGRALGQAAQDDGDPRVRLQARRLLRALGGGADLNGGAGKMLSTIEKALFLKGVKLFETMTADQLRILSNISREIQVAGGEVLFEKGDPCDYLYVIIEGQIEIVNDPGTSHQEVLATLGPTASFGEMALFGNQGRSAGARAAQDASLLGIEKDPLLLLIQEHPTISVAIIEQLASIIRNQDHLRASLARTEK